MNTKHLLTEIFIKVTEAFQGLISFQEDEVRDFEHFPECNVIFFIISWALNQVTPEMETWLERNHRNKWGVQTELKNKDRLRLWSVSASRSWAFLMSLFHPSSQPNLLFILQQTHRAPQGTWEDCRTVNIKGSISGVNKRLLDVQVSWVC